MSSDLVAHSGGWGPKLVCAGQGGQLSEPCPVLQSTAMYYSLPPWTNVENSAKSQQPDHLGGCFWW